ncbi:MAG: hypothetical protein R3F59_18270 [Myxococcota bacterium]
MPSPAERRAAVALLAVVPIRIGLDLLATVPVSPSLPQLGTAALAALLAALVAARWRTVARHPLRGPLVAITLAAAWGAARAASPFDAARYGLHLVLPALWVAALGAWPVAAAPLPTPWLAAALAVAATSLVALAAGQPAHHVLHGWPRLHGLYADLHPHAAAMATFAATALPLAAVARQRAPAALAVAASVCVAATWVRGAWLWVGLALAVAFALRRRWAALAALAAAASAALAVPALRHRFADLGAVVSATPPPEGWGALGSWRVRIWGDVLRHWAEGGPLDLLLGRGLGGHYGLHRHLEPHSDLLAVATQVGLLGLGAWLWLQGALLVGAVRRAPHDDRALAAAAALSGALAVAVVSNDYALRPTPVLWITGLAALASAGRSGSPAPSPG